VEEAGACKKRVKTEVLHCEWDAVKGAAWDHGRNMKRRGERR
jgi:hypothetical protein